MYGVRNGINCFIIFTEEQKTIISRTLDKQRQDILDEIRGLKVRCVNLVDELEIVNVKMEAQPCCSILKVKQASSKN